MILHHNESLTFALVQVSEKATDFDIMNGYLFADCEDWAIERSYKLPLGNWQLVGKASGLSESDIIPLLKRRATFGDKPLYQMGNADCLCAVPKICFASLLAAHNLSAENTYVLKMIEE